MANFGNKEISNILAELADLLEIKGANKFKVRAYRNAARNIADLDVNVQKLVANNSLEKLKGIGSGIANTITETFANGFCPLLEELKKELAPGLLELIKIPSLGPKRAYQLVKELDIKGIEDLKEALQTDKVKNLKGFGVKTTRNLKQNLKDFASVQGKILLNEAFFQAEHIISYLLKSDLVLKVDKAGSLRRAKQLIGDIDILVASNYKLKVMEYFLNYPEKYKVLAQGEEKSSILTEYGIQIDLRVVSEKEFPTALQYFTGSKEHNVRLRQRAKSQGFKLNEYGLFKEEKKIEGIDSETTLYNKLGLQYIIPELREDRGEIEAAAQYKLPQSVTRKDLKGDLHIHSNYSDGGYSIREIVAEALNRGYQYLAITDHSKSLSIAHGLSEKSLSKQIKEITKIQENFNNIKILKGIEVDILADGSLDYSNQILAELDIVIASIHTGFKQSQAQITSRIIKAMENPYVKIIAHPRGRILKRRKGYQVDMDKIIKIAAETGTCLEINSSPYRLDLDDILAKKAKDAGVKLVINTDAHHLEELDDILWGISVARRAYLQKDDILNTKDYHELLGFLRGN